MTKNLFYFSLKIAQAEHWFTGKSFSGALIFASVNPQYDERLFIELQEKYKVQNMLCTKIVFLFFCFDIQNNICTQHVVNLYFLGNSMNNILSYCGLTDAKMRASEKDLPVTNKSITNQILSCKNNRWNLKHNLCIDKKGE